MVSVVATRSPLHLNPINSKAGSSAHPLGHKEATSIRNDPDPQGSRGRADTTHSIRPAQVAPTAAIQLPLGVRMRHGGMGRTTREGDDRRGSARRMGRAVSNPLT